MIANIFVFIAALVIFFEEWVWFKLLKVMKAIAALPIFRNIENVIRNQNKWVSLILFIIPELAFIPVKLGVVWLFGNNHAYFGVILFITAKIAGTAIFAWMYAVTEPKITQFGFVCFIRDKILAIRKWAHDWIQQKEAYQKAKLFIQTVKQQLKESKENKWRRKFRAALVVAKSKM